MNHVPEITINRRENSTQATLARALRTIDALCEQALDYSRRPSINDEKAQRFIVKLAAASEGKDYVTPTLVRYEFGVNNGLFLYVLQKGGSEARVMIRASDGVVRVTASGRRRGDHVFVQTSYRYEMVEQFLGALEGARLNA